MYGVEFRQSRGGDDGIGSYIIERCCPLSVGERFDKKVSLGENWNDDMNVSNDLISGITSHWSYNSMEAMGTS